MATCEKLAGDKAKLTITVEADAFADATQKAYLHTVKKYNVPGFRKGKAPRKVIENLYGEGVFFEDAFDALWGEAYDKAVEEHSLTPIDQPKLDIETISLTEGVVFTAEVQLEPTVTLGAYKGIEVPEPTYTVEDKDVDAELEKERDRASRFVGVERAIENGDRVTLDYSGSVDGERFEGGTAEDQVLVIGSKTVIPGFEEQLVGMNAGESRDINVRFPDEYHAEALQGKDAVFAVTVKEIQVKEMPALDDEFAKDISEFDTLDELRADKKKQLTEKAEANKKVAIENAALSAVCDNASVEIPEVMIARQVDHMLRDMAYRLQMSGISLEDYMKYVGTDAAALRESYHEEAVRRVKMQLVIDAIGKAEAIDCTEEDTERTIARIAEDAQQTVEDFKKNLSAEDYSYIADRAIAEKTVDLIVANVQLVEKKADEAAQPAGAEQAE